MIAAILILGALLFLLYLRLLFVLTYRSVLPRFIVSIGQIIVVLGFVVVGMTAIEIVFNHNW